MAPKERSSKFASVVMGESMLHQGCEFAFGVVGYPMTQIVPGMQQAGVKYVGCLNEQAASYACGAVGYLTGRPGVCIVVTGPGVVHAVAGAANAKENCWPFLCFGGSHERNQRGLGAFQETGYNGDVIQCDYMRPACKYCTVLDDAMRIPFFIEQAVRYAIEGRPGASYLDVPADLMRENLDPVPPQVPKCPDPRVTMAGEEDIAAAVALLKASQAPLVITGKGASYAGASDGLRQFCENGNCPFLPSPMGKGCIPDDHPLNVSSARSAALQGADVVVLAGARLNWILHYGQPPRYRADVKMIKIDICPEEMHNGVPASVALVGHARGIVAQLNKALAASGGFKADPNGAWWQSLNKRMAESKKTSSDLAADRSSPFNYYYPLTQIQKNLPRDACIMSEGADTMDIGRTILENYLPRSRLDAGSYGTMGVGTGQILAFCMVHPNRKCVAVMGDAAFGFSLAEYETMCRYQLDATIIILNNNGIGGNPWNEEWGKDRESALKMRPTQRQPTNRYQDLCTVFGGKAWEVSTADELEKQLPEAINQKGPGIFHIRINPRTTRKAQQFGFDPTNRAGRVAKAKL